MENIQNWTDEDEDESTAAGGRMRGGMRNNVG